MLSCNMHRVNGERMKTKESSKLKKSRGLREILRSKRKKLLPTKKEVVMGMLMPLIETMMKQDGVKAL